jgi:peptidoglycan-associated lipoprotein
MYFTRAVMKGNEVGESKIFYSQGGGDGWGAAQECTGVNGEYLSLHPVVGELFGKEVLFFSSNMEGGQGGLELFYATYKGEGVYGDPVNLGPKINTPGDEITPFYFDGTLYFSSNGHPGYGGEDIFFTAWNGQVWSEPRNLGNGYNSSTDDQYFSLDREGYKGFFTSNRPGTNKSVRSKTCCDDIYEFEVPRIKVDLVVGVFDAGKKPLKGASTDLSQVVTAQQITPVEFKTNTGGNRFDFPLTLDKAYKIRVTAQGYYPDSAQLSTLGIKETKVLEKRFFLRPLPETKVKEEPEYDTITTEQPILLDNIVYGYDDDKITPESEPDLTLVFDLMKKYPEMVIELSSHTDYRGKDTYNQDLSQRRAESARKWLIQKGIGSTRIQAKGYGESLPKVVNEKMAAQNLIMKVNDTLNQEFIDNLATKEEQEIAHQLNRRTEFKIVKGPTKIVMKRAELRKKPATTTKPAPNRNRLIHDTLPATPKPAQDTIHRFSTLYYSKDLKGVPIMQFNRRELDLGKVKKGEKLEFTFEFTNKGDADLKIAIISACDCTTTDYSTDPVKPGESGKIKVTFDSTDKTESETIDVDIILENTMPGKESPIIERLQYKFELIK